jgi:hypothetical protein
VIVTLATAKAMVKAHISAILEKYMAGGFIFGGVWKIDG